MNSPAVGRTARRWRDLLAAERPIPEGLREGSRMLKLPGFRGGLLESLQALAEGLLEADVESIFGGEQGAAAATHSVTYWGAIAVHDRDHTLLQTAAAVIARSGRGVCKLTVAILDDAFTTGELDMYRRGEFWPALFATSYPGCFSGGFFLGIGFAPVRY